MKIFVPLLLMIFITGCSVINPMIEGLIPTKTEVAETVAEKSAYLSAKMAKMDHPTLTKITQSINEVSKVLTVTMPPDFEEARNMIKRKNKGPVQIALVTTIDLIEKRSKRFFEGKEQNMEEARQIIDAMLRGSKKGFEIYQREQMS